MCTMWRRPIPRVLIGLAILLVGCSPPAREQVSPAPSGKLTGTALIAIGPHEREHRLLALDLKSLKSSAVQDDFLVSSINARSGRVVASGQKGAGDIDHIYSMDGGRSAPIEGLGNPYAFTPCVAEDGRIAFVRPLGDPNDSDVSDDMYSLRIWDPRSLSETEVMTSREDLFLFDWGPNDSLILSEAPRDSPRSSFLLSLDGSRVPLRLPEDLSGIPVFAWDSKRYISAYAWKDSPPPQGADERSWDAVTTAILEGSERKALIRGWQALGWSPDGGTLLLARKNRLGVASAPDFEVEELWRSSAGAIWLGAWSEEPHSGLQDS